MVDSRRGFLSKLGIGSIVIGTAGFFKVTDAIVTEPTVVGTEVLTEPIKLQQLTSQEITELCGQILDAVDGRCTNQVVYDAVRAHLTHNTIYEKGSRPELEVNGEFILAED